jgi:hypothetical protein
MSNLDPINQGRHKASASSRPRGNKPMTKSAEDYSLLRADWEFLASACSNALFGDDRYRDMRRGDFLNAVRQQLRPVSVTDPVNNEG